MIAYFNRETEWLDAVGLTGETHHAVSFVRFHRNGMNTEHAMRPHAFHARYRMVMFEDFSLERERIIEGMRALKRVT